MMDYCEVQLLEIEDDLSVLQSPPIVPTHQWRTQLSQLHRARYDGVTEVHESWRSNARRIKRGVLTKNCDRSCLLE